MQSAVAVLVGLAGEAPVVKSVVKVLVEGAGRPEEVVVVEARALVMGREQAMLVRLPTLSSISCCLMESFPPPTQYTVTTPPTTSPPRNSQHVPSPLTPPAITHH